MSAALLALRSEIAAAKDRVADIAVEMVPVLLNAPADAAQFIALRDRLQSAYDEKERLVALLELRKAEAGHLAVAAS